MKINLDYLQCDMPTCLAGNNNYSLYKMSTQNEK